VIVLLPLPIINAAANRYNKTVSLRGDYAGFERQRLNLLIAVSVNIQPKVD
jgi:hypothetical protein